MSSQNAQTAKSNRTSQAEQLKQRRAEQLSQIAETIVSIEARQQELSSRQRQLALLESVSLGLYDEVDKLTKKAPAETITDLALEQVNDVIRETKELLKQDVYIQRLKEFIPAGDNPQHRDVVVVLRQVRQGLDRFRKYINPLSDFLQARLDEARAIQVAVNLSLVGKVSIQQSDFSDYNVHAPLTWMNDKFPQQFNFDKLDNISILDYFAKALQE